MTKKEGLRSVAFLLVVCLLLIGMTDIFEMDFADYARRFYSYRCLEKNTVDAVYIGTSGVGRYWLGAKAYDEYGMTVYPLSVDAMPVWLFPIMMDEALAYHNPQLMIFDARAFGQGHSAENADVGARRVLDSMEFFSANRINAAMKTMEMVHRLDDSKPAFDLSYIFSFMKFHTQWSEKDFSIDTQYDKQKHEFGGYHIGFLLSVLHEPQTPMEYDEDYYVPLDPISEEALYEVLNHAKELGVQTLFVDSPQFMSKTEMGRANTLRKILQEQGATYISYNTPNAAEELNVQMNPETDYYDEAHVNFYGAEKFTASLAAYLDQHYDLPDRRNEETVRKDWDGVYDHIKKTVKDYEAVHKEQGTLKTASGGE